MYVYYLDIAYYSLMLVAQPIAHNMAGWPDHVMTPELNPLCMCVTYIYLT